MHSHDSRKRNDVPTVDQNWSKRRLNAIMSDHGEYMGMIGRSADRWLIFLLVWVILLSCVPVIGARQLPVIRISVENTPAHVQTRAVQRYADLLAERLEGRYDVQFYQAASLFRDVDIFRALTQGKVEIAVPGTWQFDRYVPEVGLFLLPSLYGRDPSVTYALMESAVGAQIVSAIERVMDVQVLGRWIDLGHTHIFSTHRAIRSRDDFAGKRIRVAGGVGNVLRVNAMGATALTIAWPDFASALRRNTVDGVLTSYETIASARLWEAGINAVYEDRQYFAQYVPIVSRQFWERIPQDVRDILTDSWEGLVDQARREAAVSQVHSRSDMLRQGVTITMVSDDYIRRTRDLLMPQEPQMALEMGIPSDIYTQFSAFIRRNSMAQVHTR